MKFVRFKFCCELHLDRLPSDSCLHLEERIFPVMPYKAAVAFHLLDISLAIMPNLPSCLSVTHCVIKVYCSIWPLSAFGHIFHSHVLFYLPCFALSSSSHPACAIQWYHILPVTRRLRLLCPRAPPPSLLSLWQPKAAQSPPKMPTRRAGIRGAVCGPQTALGVRFTAPQTAWTAPRQWPWPWSQQQARDMHL